MLVDVDFLSELGLLEYCGIMLRRPRVLISPLSRGC